MVYIAAGIRLVTMTSGPAVCVVMIMRNEDMAPCIKGVIIPIST